MVLINVLSLRSSPTQIESDESKQLDPILIGGFPLMPAILQWTL